VKLDGAISITRSQSNVKPYEFVTIEVVDKKSGSRFLEVTMSVEEFGRAVLNLASRPCMLDVGGLEVIGKQMEHKTIAVDVDTKKLMFAREQEFKTMLLDACRPYMVDGWKPDMWEDGYNGHRSKDNKYEVTFRRYV